MQETMPGARRRGRRGQESGLPMEESIKMVRRTEIEYVHGVANPQIEDD